MFAPYVGTRFFRKRLINYLAVLVVAFSVMMPIVVLAVMEGFALYMAEQIRGALADIVVGSVSLDSVVSAPGRTADEFAALPDVAGAAPFIRNFVIVKSNRYEGIVSEPALLQGIDPRREEILQQQRGDRADLATAIFAAKNDARFDDFRAWFKQYHLTAWNIFYLNSRVETASISPEEALAEMVVKLPLEGQAAFSRIQKLHMLTWEDVHRYNDDILYNYVDSVILKPEEVFNQYPVEETFDSVVFPEAIVNVELASVLGIAPGDTFTVAAVSKEGRPVKRKFRMTASLRPYSAAKGDRFDMPSIVVHFEEARVLFGTEGNATGINVWLKDGVDLRNAKTALELNTRYSVYTWKDMRSNILRAVENENKLLSVVLLCIGVAAGFGILSIIYTSVSEKTKDIGILKAVGVSPLKIVSVFMVKTLWISVIGVALGIAIAFLVVDNINFLSELLGWTPFSSELYYLPDDEGLPVSWENAGVLFFSTASFCISIMAGLYPSIRAASLNAVDAIRND